MFVRRFCNHAILLLAVVHFLHLRSAAQPVSEEMMLATSFCGDYGNVFTSLLANTDYETMLEAFQMGVSLLGGTENKLWLSTGAVGGRAWTQRREALGFFCKGGCCAHAVCAEVEIAGGSFLQLTPNSNKD